jgi:A/G-specific adenine glycosylase
MLRELKAFYKKNKRSHLPWRKTTDPYKILVSEIMLQQTQASRVVPYYMAFIKQFPNARALANAPLSKVLLAWQGLGYNRRAKYLQDAARVIAKEGYAGQKLPGVGPYTRGAVMAFAYNKPEVFIETNIRTVLFHHMKKNTTIYRSVSDKELLPIVEEELRKSKMEPREFYSAMMDYGSHLKKQGIKLNTRSAHYKKQSRFEGSARQKRAAKLRMLLRAGASEAALRKVLHS